MATREAHKYRRNNAPNRNRLSLLVCNRQSNWIDDHQQHHRVVCYGLGLHRIIEVMRIQPTLISNSRPTQTHSYTHTHAAVWTESGRCIVHYASPYSFCLQHSKTNALCRFQSGNNTRPAQTYGVYRVFFSVAATAAKKMFRSYRSSNKSTTVTTMKSSF